MADVFAKIHKSRNWLNLQICCIFCLQLIKSLNQVVTPYMDSNRTLLVALSVWFFNSYILQIGGITCVHPKLTNRMFSGITAYLR